MVTISYYWGTGGILEPGHDAADSQRGSLEIFDLKVSTFHRKHTRKRTYGDIIWFLSIAHLDLTIHVASKSSRSMKDL